MKTIATHNTCPVADWKQNKIKPQQVTKYLAKGKCFIDAAKIEERLRANCNTDSLRIRNILQKSLAIETLTPAETACLINVSDPELWAEMEHTAGLVQLQLW